MVNPKKNKIIYNFWVTKEEEIEMKLALKSNSEYQVGSLFISIDKRGEIERG